MKPFEKSRKIPSKTWKQKKYKHDLKIQAMHLMCLHFFSEAKKCQAQKYFLFQIVFPTLISHKTLRVEEKNKWSPLKIKKKMGLCLPMLNLP